MKPKGVALQQLLLDLTFMAFTAGISMQGFQNFRNIFSPPVMATVMEAMAAPSCSTISVDVCSSLSTLMDTIVNSPSCDSNKISQHQGSVAAQDIISTAAKSGTGNITNTICCIGDRIYICGVSAITTSSLKLDGITRILSVGAVITDDLPETVTHHKSVQLLDLATADLLSILPECVVFIAESCAHKSARVLVHCHAGISRSCAVVVAFFMVSRSLSASAAFRLLKKSYNVASPNLGFVSQLKLFETMGNRLDEIHPQMRLHRLQHLAEGRHETPITAAALIPTPTMGTVIPPPKSVLRCKKCRCWLAVDEHFLMHEAGRGQTAFAYRKRGESAIKSAAACSSYFTEPHTWMDVLDSAGDYGKLSCPNCSARVGVFAWIGVQCSCGAWVTPAFQLHASSVDLIAIAAPATLASRLASGPSEVATQVMAKSMPVTRTNLSQYL